MQQLDIMEIQEEAGSFTSVDLVRIRVVHSLYYNKYALRKRRLYLHKSIPILIQARIQTSPLTVLPF